MECCICGKEIDGRHGNNPRPVKDDGMCCDDCNQRHVIPARVEAMVKTMRERRQH